MVISYYVHPISHNIQTANQTKLLFAAKKKLTLPTTTMNSLSQQSLFPASVLRAIGATALSLLRCGSLCPNLPPLRSLNLLPLRSVAVISHTALWMTEIVEKVTRKLCYRKDDRKNAFIFTARCTLVQSAVLRSHVVCLSVCPSVRPSVRL